MRLDTTVGGLTTHTISQHVNYCPIGTGQFSPVACVGFTEHSVPDETVGFAFVGHTVGFATHLVGVGGHFVGDCGLQETLKLSY